MWSRVKVIPLVFHLYFPHLEQSQRIVELLTSLSCLSQSSARRQPRRPLRRRTGVAGEALGGAREAEVSSASSTSTGDRLDLAEMAGLERGL
jgi:hypothetical protein